MSERLDRLVAWQWGDTSSRGAHSSVESMVVLWAVSYNQGRGNKVLLVSVMQEGWVERNFFSYIYYSFIWLGSSWQHMGSLVVVHGLRSCDTGAQWLQRKGLVAPLGVGSQPHHACPLTQPCLTLCHPMDRSPPNSSVCGISQTRTQEWIAISSSKGSSQPRDQAHVPCTARLFLTTGPPGNVPRGI